MAPFLMRFTIIMLALCFATTAQGQVGDWFAAGSVVFNNDDADRAIEDSLSGGQVSIGRHMTENLSLEGLLGYSSITAFCKPGDCYPDQKHLDISANLLTYYDRGSVFAPYILVGVGYLGVDAEEGPQFVRNTGKENNPTGSVGLGFKWRMGESNFSIRAEHRVRVAFDSDRLTDQLTTIGLQYSFGRTKADPGVPAIVATTKTTVERGGDGDGDRVFDSKDECPNTPFGVPVDPRGCSLDSDMDGVTSDKDRCPASRAGAEVNRYGCEVDQDEDGVPDHRDDCLFTRTGVRVDVKGCEIRDIISLPGVNFETGHDILLPGTEYLLQQAADTLKIHLDLRIEVAGHTDNVGNEDLNQGLSMRRAKTVRDFLIRFGVDADRLTFEGYGEAQPIADNGTADGRATNRRVELRLVAN